MKSKFNELITGVEINQQSELWSETIEIMRRKEKEIQKFLMEFDGNPPRVIFTGAGTSEFVGNSITSYLNKKSQYRIESIATTDIVSTPDLYLNRSEATILVSCARSGNSPESVGAVRLVDQLVDDIYHIFLTCNPDGKLANYAKGKDNVLSILMPEKSNDKGFAMTGSFTCMCLSGIILFQLEKLNIIKKKMENISDIVKSRFENIYNLIKEISSLEVDRIVCLGDGTLKGLAQEASLKILELSSGYIPTSFDSFLAFRHGPKSIITDNTLIITFMSNNEYTRRYELDLLKELKNEGGGKVVLSIDNKLDWETERNSTYYFSFNNSLMTQNNDVFSIFGHIYIAQIYAFMKSIQLGINPDTPCPGGEVNRVVQGVTLYDYSN